MKLLIEAFKSARKTEIILIIAAVCALAVCMCGPAGDSISSSDEEKRMGHILSQIEGAGKVQVMLSNEGEASRRGAVVIASGAGQIDVQIKLQQAVHTLTGLELNRIEVIESKR